MTKWKDCVKEPSELGKKVLCQKHGDFYVAMRMDEYYIPMPFIDHYFCKDLCTPETWCEIDFPEPYTGYVRMAPEGLGSEIMKLGDLKERYPEIYRAVADPLIASIGKLPKPAGME